MSQEIGKLQVRAFNMQFQMLQRVWVDFSDKEAAAGVIVYLPVELAPELEVAVAVITAGGKDGIVQVERFEMGAIRRLRDYPFVIEGELEEAFSKLEKFVEELVNPGALGVDTDLRISTGVAGPDGQVIRTMTRDGVKESNTYQYTSVEGSRHDTHPSVLLAKAGITALFVKHEVGVCDKKVSMTFGQLNNLELELSRNQVHRISFNDKEIWNGRAYKGKAHREEPEPEATQDFHRVRELFTHIHPDDKVIIDGQEGTYRVVNPVWRRGGVEESAPVVNVVLDAPVVGDDTVKVRTVSALSIYPAGNATRFAWMGRRLSHYGGILSQNGQFPSH